MNIKEYNAAFKTDLTKEQLKEIIMRNPITEVSQVTEKAISIQWLKDWNKKNGDNWNLGYTIDYIIKEWEKENER